MRAVKAVGFLGALAALMLAGCGDGSIKSPDFQSTTTLESIDVQPVVAGQPNALPAGTILSYRASATFSETVQPGTKDAAGHEISARTRTENITADAAWTSSNDAVATVAKGIVTGKMANATPITITASYQGKSDTVNVTVTDAVLKSVVYAAETNVPRTSNDQYTVATGNTAQFQLYGRFSDQQSSDAPRRLDGTQFGVQWSSNAPDVASNAPANDANFKTLAAGTAVITGTVTQQPGSTSIADVNPKSASATLISQAASAFCEREFRAPTAMAVQGPQSVLCLGLCSVSDTDLAIDGDATTEATLSIPLALLTGASISFDVSDVGNPLVVGKPAGFTISRSADILSVELLSSLSLSTLNCDVNGKNCTVVESLDSAPGNDALRLALLGLVGGVPQYFVATTQPITQPANGLRLTFQGGLVGAVASLHVQSSCAAAVVAAP